MEIIRDKMHWGEMQIMEEEQQIHFHAVGQLPKYGEILRVWGLRKNAQPLLIGVAEPENDCLVVRRTMSRQYLRSVGYDILPEQYVAGVVLPVQAEKNDVTQEQHFSDPLIQCLSQNKQIQLEWKQDIAVFRCPIAPEKEFPFAFIFSFCKVENDMIQLLWDNEKGCPVLDSPQ